MRHLRILGLAALALASGGLVAGASAAPAAPGFVPAAIAGNWTGTWTNLTFGTTGAATMTVKVIKVAPKKVKVKVKGKKKFKIKLVPRPSKLTFTADWGGNVFGCSDPAPEAATLTKGSGPNHWNAAGFEVKASTAAFGALDLIYDHAARTLNGSGSNPPCAGGLQWTLASAFPDANTFSGTVTITLPNGTVATSQLALTRG
ncbi:MAG: hypothetical protein QOE36_466 [Gaiellaceae bacterium]|nr:hypothetical protein [Gaiellaceae bacterium]